MRRLIKKGRVLNPATGLDGVFDVLLEHDTVVKIEKDIQDTAEQVIDASGKWVVPGFIDLHVHLREPGYEYKETIATGTRSAAKGGYTTICAMPNTKPVCDSAEIVSYILDKAKTEGIIHVLPIGAITVGQKGEVLADIETMVAAGACAISEDGKSVPTSILLKQAMEQAKKLGVPVMSHCEDIDLVAGGAINEGVASKELGIPGISNDSEEVIVARDVILSKTTGARLHICHISTKGSVEQVRFAKEQGLLVTAEVTPHHFTLSDDAIKTPDTNTKMNPPLRSKEDVAALRKALQDNTIETIATDHAPHAVSDKDKPYEKAAFGIVGFETALPLGITVLVEGGYLTPLDLVAKMSTNPAKVLGIDKGDISVGKTADIAIIDPEIAYTISPETFASKSKNSPFGGYPVKGRVDYTFVGGQMVVCNGELVEE